MNFRALVEAWRRAGREAHERPRSFAEAAAAFGLSRQHLYALMAGTKRAPDWTTARVAKALGQPVGDVEQALQRSRDAARRRRAAQVAR